MVLCAVLARVLGKLGVQPMLTGLTRTLIYVGLYMGWGLSVSQRILHGEARRYMLGVSSLIIFWFFVRSIKYFFVADPFWIRQLWYWYYFPMLFIPLLSLFVSLSLGKPDDSRLPRWTKALYLPAALCLLLVLTNDLHQLVFRFPAGEVWSDQAFSYRPGYYLVLGLEIACALVSFGIMLHKCRLTHRKKYLPAILLACSVLYALIYASGAEWMYLLAGDITAAQCLLFTCILESCIQCGMIRANTGYAALFEAGTLGAQIADGDGCVRCASANAPVLRPAVMRAAMTGAVRLDRDTLLKANPIDGGCVFWREDISDIASLLEKLEQNRKAIEQSNRLERKNCRIQLSINALREKNRLYDLLQKKIARQIALLDRLFAQYNAAEDPQARRSLLAKIAVIGAYIKRCGNLIFLGEKSDVTDTAELSLCIGESFANLELLGVECAMDIPGDCRIPVGEAIRVYDFFEEVTETALNDLHELWLKARVLDDSVAFHLEAECESSLEGLGGPDECAFFEDGVWRFTLHAQRAGEAL